MKIFILPALILFILLPGCGNKDKQEKGKQPEKRFRFFREIPGSGFSTSPGGLLYLRHTRAKGRSPMQGDVVRMDIRTGTHDLELFNTFQSKANYFLKVDTPRFKGDIAEILPHLSVGDSVSTKMTARDLYGSDIPDPVKEGDTVFTQFVLREVFNEQALIRAYLSEEGIEEYDSAGKGVLIHYLEKGKGGKISVGDSVVIDFELRMLDNTLVNSSWRSGRPLGFVFGKKPVIPGWEEAMKQLREGDIVLLLLPSGMAFGSRGIPPDEHSSRIPIPPYSPLVYKMKVREVFKKNS